MKCRNCGAELKEGAKFCSRCGTKTEQQAAGKPAAQRPSGTPAGQKPSGVPAVQRPSGTPAGQKPSGTPAAQRPSGAPTGQRPSGTPAPQRQAAAPAPRQQAEPVEQKKKKSPVLMIVLILVFLLVGTAAGVIGWKFREKLFNIGAEDEASAEEESSEDEAEAEEAEEDEESEKEEEEPADEEQEDDGAGEATAPAATEAAAPAETEAATEPATAPVETEAPTEAAEAIHRYEVIVKDCTWTEAYDEAKSRGGNLVRFETAEEYEHVKNTILSDSSYRNLKLWIGGARSSTSNEYHWANPDGTFGQDVLNSEDYTSVWMRNEPSFRDEGIGQDEYFMNLFYYSSENRWVWNDVPNDIIAVVSSYRGDVGYICEYEE